VLSAGQVPLPPLPWAAAAPSRAVTAALDAAALAAACRHLEAAVGHGHAALQAAPRDPAGRADLAGHLAALAQTRLLLGDHAGAARAVADLFRLPASDYLSAFRGAHCLVACMPLAARDEKLSAEERTAQAAAYADRAVRLLRQAVQRGYRDVGALRRAPFDTLRGNEAFRRLVRGAEDGAGEDLPDSTDN
jgi:hypothetical protein